MMKGTLGLKKGSVPFKNDLETTLVLSYHVVYDIFFISSQFTS